MESILRLIICVVWVGAKEQVEMAFFLNNPLLLTQKSVFYLWSWKFWGLLFLVYFAVAEWSQHQAGNLKGFESWPDTPEVD